MGRARNTVKRGTFWRPGVSAAPLSYGEERTAVRQGHGQGAPGRIIKGLPAPAADPSTVKGTSHWWYPSKWCACTLKPVGRRLRLLPQTNTFGHCKACYVYMYLYVHLWCSTMFVMQCNAMEWNSMAWHGMVLWFVFFLMCILWNHTIMSSKHQQT